MRVDLQPVESRQVEQESGDAPHQDVLSGVTVSDQVGVVSAHQRQHFQVGVGRQLAEGQSGVREELRGWGHVPAEVFRSRVF